MGIQKKHGKGRLDKWYKLAKEKGYRARAAFKLIQLNRKYNFLEKSKVLLDLCAAPGSWCQVAAETMPANSLIVGVDLAPIKPIPRTITFQSDITTEKCRATIRQHLKTWKADTVLHDGAPNVGTAWVQDAFSQAELALQAMKLATEFLIEGGTFVTKVFRSKDYNALLWVFNQLFTKVEATKPPSSRNVSAEIFVVCRGFRAPKRIDPKFLDPRSVFAELTDPTPNHEAKVFNPEKKKRKRDGYEEGDYTQFKEAPASEFIQTSDPIAMLGSLNKLSFDQRGNGDTALAALDQLPETTVEIRDCCADLKVLGRKEFRLLLRWRLKAREKFGFAAKKNPSQQTEIEEVAEIEPMDEELQIHEELQKLNEKESSRKKRERRRENERKQKEIVRMQMHMLPPTEIGLEQAGPDGEDAMFALRAVDRAGAVDKVARGKMGLAIRPQDRPRDADTSGEEESDLEEDRLERELDTLYVRYQEKKSESDAKYRAKKARKEHKDGEWEGFSEDAESSADEIRDDEDSERSSDDEETNNARPLITTLDISKDEKGGLTRRATMFFDQEIFRNIGGLETEAGEDSAIDLDGDTTGDDDGDGTKHTHLNEDKSRSAEQAAASQPPTSTARLPLSSTPDNTASEFGFSADDPDEDNGNGFEVVRNSGGSEWELQGEPRRDGRLDINIITAEAMTLAQQIAAGEKSTYDLMDEGFNKYSFRDRDGLPEWFLDDEGRHSKPHRPITAAGAAAIKEKLRALNARPIKKVREAKDRKKFKAAQRLEKLRKKSALVADEEGMTEKEKAQNIVKLMSKAAKKKPKQQVKVVVARGGNRGISGRPRGVKGKYKIVDARLKKDVRAEKRLAKKRH
ncbi:MAG: et-dependent rRNA methyltransferase spb-1 [Lasallia pustulata]|uniref:Et-dependent rRNA methyltransferase spb-1 n=1 Tax=Lasallia pustulata TaxID=136370 RepID=A0A5M8PGY7_9LECA|nr:MAG: et-dependent rRNA methyltransferase spb-1 [Lasallia pustulata]